VGNEWEGQSCGLTRILWYWYIHGSSNVAMTTNVGKQDFGNNHGRRGRAFGEQPSYLIVKQILNGNGNLSEHLSNVLIEQEVVLAEEFQMMLVEFQAKMIDYKVLGWKRSTITTVRSCHSKLVYLLLSKQFRRLFSTFSRIHNICYI
jgi:hypothetical protein